MLLLPPAHVQVDCHEVGRIVFFSKHLIKDQNDKTSHCDDHIALPQNLTLAFFAILCDKFWIMPVRPSLLVWLIHMPWGDLT